MKIIPQILKDLPIQQAKFQCQEITGQQFEDYLLEVIEYCAEVSEINPSIDGMDYVKDYLWATLEFTI